MRLRRQRGQAVNLGRRALNAQELTGLDLPERRRADQIERTRLRGHHVSRPQFAEPERAKASRIDDGVQGPADRDDQRIGAFHALECVEQLVFRLARLGAGDQVDQDFAVRRGLEDRALGDQIGPQRLGVGEIAVVRERERAFVVTGENRLRIDEHRGAGGGVARVTDRHVARQPREHRLAEDVRHQPHPAVRPGYTSPVHRYHPGRLLAAMLEAVQPQIGDARCVRDARYADDAAHLAISLPYVEEWR